MHLRSESFTVAATFLLIFQSQGTHTSYLYQYHRKNTITDTSSPVQNVEDGDEDRHMGGNCRHVKLNIHIGQFVINETIVDSCQPESESVDIGKQKFNDPPLGKFKYKKDYKKLKLPLFKYSEKKSSSTLSMGDLGSTHLRPLVYSNGIPTVDKESGAAKPGKDSMKMINDIVKDIVKKYKTKFNPNKSTRDLVDLSQCICQFQESHSLPDTSLFKVKLDHTRPTLSSLFEPEHSTLTSEDKERLKQVIIDKVIALLNASKSKPTRGTNFD